MNAEIVELVERPFREVVEDLLTAVVGGVVNEPVIFDVRHDLYPLAEPASRIRRITGTSGGARHAFLPDVDFAFNAARNSVEWEPGGVKPDDETQFYVDYVRTTSRSPLTDINVGSVTRTLNEAIGREIATLYQQVNEAYKAGFIDSATGTSLDLVVSILGVQRKGSELASGLLTLFRQEGARGNITVPAATRVGTAKGDAVFQTAEQRTLQQGQVRMDVPIRATDAFPGEAGLVDAGLITELAQPVAGIARVTNFDPTVLGVGPETDEELRARAKAMIRALGKATLAALRQAIFEGRAKLQELWEPNQAPSRRTVPGVVSMLVDAEPERFPDLRGRVEEARAAGVRTALVARHVFFRPRLAVRIEAGFTPEGREKVRGGVIDALERKIATLDSGDPAKGAELLDAVKGVDGVEDVAIVDALTWRSDLARPGGDVFLDALVETALRVAPDGEEALRAELARVIGDEEPVAPTERRIPDPSLIRNEAGEPASAAEIESGAFEVRATVDGEAWRIALDVSEADILLSEAADAE